MSIMGPVWAPDFLLDTTYMRLQDHSKTLIMLRWLKVRNEGPIVLMMLAQKNVPYRGETPKTRPKIIFIILHQGLQGRGSEAVAAPH